jgi:hypothetical protein
MARECRRVLRPEDDLDVATQLIDKRVPPIRKLAGHARELRAKKQRMLSDKPEHVRIRIFFVHRELQCVMIAETANIVHVARED